MQAKLTLIVLLAVLGVIVLAWLAAGWQVGLALLLIEGQILLALSGIGNVLKVAQDARLLQRLSGDESPKGSELPL
jgi:hypothetical protein